MTRLIPLEAVRLLLGLLVCYCLSCVCGHVHYHRSHFTHMLQEERKAAKMQCVMRKGVVGHCVPPIQCPAQVQTQSHVHCSLSSGNTGVCCTTGQNHTDTSNLEGRAGRSGHFSLVLSHSMLQNIIRDSEHQVHDLFRRSKELLKHHHGLLVEHGTPSFILSHNLAIAKEEIPVVHRLSTMALEGVFATRTFKLEQGVSNSDVVLGRLGDTRGTGLDMCPIVRVCSTSHYRTLDGSCNNLLQPRWGAAHSPTSRILPPRYSDGIWDPRRSVVGQEALPSARLLSSVLFPDVDLPHPYGTLLVMQFGQFIAHDVTLSPSMRHENGSGVSCCEPGGEAELPHHMQHFACFPIHVPESDPFYSQFGQRCMNFVRGMLAPRYDCLLGYAQQMNAVSHFVDGSAVYGTEHTLNKKLRTFRGGQLLVTREYGRDLPPQTHDSDHCAAIEGGRTCFHSGDLRTNQMVGLVVMHLVFLREHNHLASELYMLNPHWTDEILFQEARHIVVAEIQHVLYSEWLPIVIGMQAMEDYGLTLTKQTHSFDYDPNVNPSTTTEFSVAAFRFGHSTVDGLLRIMKQNRIEEQIFLPDVMFDPSRMRKRYFFDQYLDMLSSQPMQRADVSITQALTSYMFHGSNPFGLDLASLNIQRGRDHGVGTYNDYRELQGIQRAFSFQDFSDRFPQEAIDVLQEVYLSPEDVDLFVGGLLEDHVAGAVVGPTFLGIIADQFSRFKLGDRFFYENGDQAHSFTIQQLQELKKTTMGRLLCDNSDHLELQKLTLNPFLRKDHPGNFPLDCDHPGVPRIDLRHWKQNLA